MLCLKLQFVVSFMFLEAYPQTGTAIHKRLQALALAVPIKVSPTRFRDSHSVLRHCL